MHYCWVADKQFAAIIYIMFIETKYICHVNHVAYLLIESQARARIPCLSLVVLKEK